MSATIQRCLALAGFDDRYLLTRSAIDHVQERLDKVASIGAIPIDFAKEDPVKRIKADYPDGVRRSVDYRACECVDAKLKRIKGLIMRQAISVTGKFAHPRRTCLDTRAEEHKY